MPNATNAKDAAALEAGYAGWHRVYESIGILATTTTGVWLCLRLAKCPPLSGWWMPLAALLGLLFADFVSGVVHWLFDTWGSVDTPFFGKLAIRTFRHHHVDEKAIVRHDFVETNGHNFGLALPLTTFGLAYVKPAEASLPDVFLGMTLVVAAVFVSTTSQIHKWAHMAKPPRLIGLLQRARILLSPEHHAVHHAAPHTDNYCITVGWMNGPLRRVRFFRIVERVITAATGVLPRVDDLGEDAAKIAEATAEARDVEGIAEMTAPPSSRRAKAS